MESSWLPVIGAVLLPQIPPAVGGFFLRNRIKSFRPKHQPSWNPPGWVFWPVWTTLYTLMGYASYLVWREGELSESAEVDSKVRCALTVYGIQLLLNWIWPSLYFGLRRIDLAFLDFVALLVSVIISFAEFYAVLPFAAYLLIPYLCWGFFAITVHFYVWMYNESGFPKKGKEN